MQNICSPIFPEKQVVIARKTCSSTGDGNLSLTIGESIEVLDSSQQQRSFLFGKNSSNEQGIFSAIFTHLCDEAKRYDEVEENASKTPDITGVEPEINPDVDSHTTPNRSPSSPDSSPNSRDSSSSSPDSSTNSRDSSSSSPSNSHSSPDSSPSSPSSSPSSPKTSPSSPHNPSNNAETSPSSQPSTILPECSGGTNLGEREEHGEEELVKPKSPSNVGRTTPIPNNEEDGQKSTPNVEVTATEVPSEEVTTQANADTPHQRVDSAESGLGANNAAQMCPEPGKTGTAESSRTGSKSGITTPSPGLIDIESSDTEENPHPFESFRRNHLAKLQSMLLKTPIENEVVAIASIDAVSNSYLYVKDLRTILPEKVTGSGWLNTEVIHAVGLLLNNRQEMHHDEVGIKTSIISPYRVAAVKTKNAFKKDLTNPLDYDVIMGAFNKNLHWVLLVGDLSKEKFYVLDSMPGSIVAQYENELRFFRERISETASKEEKEKILRMDISLRNKKCPKQNDGSSCGIYVLSAMDALSSYSALEHTSDQIDFRRYYYFASLLSHKILGT